MKVVLELRTQRPAAVQTKVGGAAVPSAHLRCCARVRAHSDQENPDMVPSGLTVLADGWMDQAVEWGWGSRSVSVHREGNQGNQ